MSVRYLLSKVDGGERADANAPTFVSRGVRLVSLRECLDLFADAAFCSVLLLLRIETVRPSITDSPILACRRFRCQHSLALLPEPDTQKRNDRTKAPTDGSDERTNERGLASLPPSDCASKNKRGAERSLDANKVCFARWENEREREREREREA